MRKNDYNGMDRYMMECYLKKKIQWAPVKSSIYLGNTVNEGVEVSNDEEYQEQVSQINLKIPGSQRISLQRLDMQKGLKFNASRKKFINQTSMNDSIEGGVKGLVFGEVVKDVLNNRQRLERIEIQNSEIKKLLKNLINKNNGNHLEANSADSDNEDRPKTKAQSMVYPKISVNNNTIKHMSKFSVSFVS